MFDYIHTHFHLQLQKNPFFSLDYQVDLQNINEQETVL